MVEDEAAEKGKADLVADEEEKVTPALVLVPLRRLRQESGKR